MNPMLAGAGVSPSKSGKVSAASTAGLSKRSQDSVVSFKQLKALAKATIPESILNTTSGTKQSATGKVLIYVNAWSIVDGQRNCRIYGRCSAPKKDATPTSPDKRHALRINANAFDSDSDSDEPTSAANAGAAAAASPLSPAQVRDVEKTLCMKKTLPIDGAPAGQSYFQCTSAKSHVITVQQGELPNPGMIGEIIIYDCNESGFPIFTDGPRDRVKDLVMSETGFNEAASPGTLGEARTAYSATVFDDTCRVLVGMSGDNFFRLGAGVDPEDEESMKEYHTRVAAATDVALGRCLLVRATLEIKRFGSNKPTYSINLNMP